MADHEVERNGLKSRSNEDESLSAFFEDPTSNTYTPRVIMINIDDITINTMQNSSLWNQLKTKDPHFYTLKPDHTAKLNFASAIYNCGPDICEPIWHRIDSMIERADNFQGFKFIYGIGGGTSAGLSSHFKQQLSEKYKKKAIFEYVVYPSMDEILSDDNVIYNMLLTHSPSLTDIDAVGASFVFDNDKLYDLTSQYLCHSTVQSLTNYEIINEYISRILSSITIDYRYIDYTMTDYQGQLVPFPRMKYLSTAYVPLSPKEDYVKSVRYLRSLRYGQPKELLIDGYIRNYGVYMTDVNGLINEMYGNRCINKLVMKDLREYDLYTYLQHFLEPKLQSIEYVNTDDNKYLALRTCLRGDWKHGQITGEYMKWKLKMSKKMIDWICTGMMVSYTRDPGSFGNPRPEQDDCVIQHAKYSTTLIAGNTTIKDYLKRKIIDPYDKIIQYKNNRHLYENEGIDDECFKEARNSLQNIYDDYTEVLYEDEETETESS